MRGVAVLGSRPPVVWIVSAEHWPRALLRAELIERGYDAVGFVRVADLLRAWRARRPALVVVDLAGQHGLDVAFRVWERAGVPVLGIAGAAEASWDSVRGFAWAALLRRPQTIGGIADSVDRVARAQPEGTYVLPA
jgi:DNA-binding response OmpR family regulator